MALQSRVLGAKSSAFDPVQRGTQSIGDALRRNDELARETSEVEERVEQLKVRYEQWFIGVERREPSREREELKREVAQLKGAFTKNTGLRFRIQSLHARFICYERMWQRSAREKEQGTYRRDIARVRAKAEKRRADGPTQVPAMTLAAAPLAVAPLLSPRSNSGASAVPGLSDAQLRVLHAEYVDAKQRCAEDTSRVTLDALARSLAKQVPELLARFRATAVDFRVAVQDGRTVLKAVPRT